VPEAKVIVGVAGWVYDDWKDIVYPAAEKNKLRYLARYFDLVEINSSFYRPFKPSYSEKWLSDVSGNDRFRFAAKLWRRFTHETKTTYTRDEVSLVKDGLRPLKEAGKLVSLLIQFPFFFHFTPESKDLVRRIAEDFAEYPRVLEVRDISWGMGEAMEFIRGQGLNVACLDMPAAKRSFRARSLVTGSIGYMRMHGRHSEAWFSKDAGRDEKYDYNYSDGELEALLERIREMREHAQEVVVVWNNHPHGKAAANALQFLNKLTGEKVDAPHCLIETYPELRSIARTERRSLFD